MEKQKPTFNACFGETIRKRRRELGMSQKELGEACGYDISASTVISKIELGVNTIPVNRLLLLANALSMPVAELFNGTKGYSENKKYAKRPS